MLSGIIDERADEVSARFEKAGFEKLSSRSEDGWSAMLMTPARR